VRDAVVDLGIDREELRDAFFDVPLRGDLDRHRVAARSERHLRQAHLDHAIRRLRFDESQLVRHELADALGVVARDDDEDLGVFPEALLEDLEPGPERDGLAVPDRVHFGARRVHHREFRDDDVAGALDAG
jgi:hypothetical protein